MSAWIVAKGHIDVLVQAMVVEGLIAPRQANETGAMLWEENRHSVAVRYPRDADGEWPGPIGLTTATIAGYRFAGIEAPLADGAVLAAIHCINYQCAEWEGYDAEPGMVALEALRQRIVARHGLATDDEDHHLWAAWSWGFDSITEAVGGVR